MSPIVNFSGIASGFQWQDLIEQVTAAEHARRVKPISNRIAERNSASASWRSYGTSVTNLSSAAEAFKHGEIFGRMQATTSESGRVSVAAAKGATPASYQVEVLDVARAERLASGSFTSGTDALAVAGTITIGGVEIAIEEADDLETIRDRINAAAADDPGMGVTASVMRAGEGDYQLVLSSSRTGAAGIALEDDAETGVLASLGILDGAGVKNAVVAGSDASIRVDGITITRSTNTIDDALEGLTFTVQSAAPGSTFTLTVEEDRGGITEAAQALVDRFNDVRTFVQRESASGRPLARDAALRGSFDAFRRAILDSHGDPEQSAYTRATLIGIEFDRNGMLTFDETRLQAALDDDPAGTQDLLTSIGAVMEERANLVTRSGDGTVAVRTEANRSGVTALERRRDTIEDRLEQRAQAMARQFVAMEQALGRIQSESAWLDSQIQGLSANRLPNRK